MRLAMLVNERSGWARRDPRRLDDLERAFASRGTPVFTGNRTDPNEAIETIRDADPDVLFVCGGDGTLRLTLTRLLAAYGDTPLPHIALLRGGTMNTVASSAEIHASPLTQLRQILRRIDEERPLEMRTRRMLRVNGTYGFIFGLGGFSRFIERYEEGGDPTVWRGAGMLLRTILSMYVGGSYAASLFPPFPVHLWRDGQPILAGTPVVSISAASIRHIGFRFKPYLGAERTEGTMGLLVLHRLPRRLLLHLPRFFRGTAVTDPDILQVPASDLFVRVNEPMRPLLDGDLLEPAREFSIAIGPSLSMVTG